MKTILIGINAKYIHPNLAIRLLKANTSFDVDLKEFTIKDQNEAIIEHLKGYDIIGFSCYIWNIEKIKEILKQLKNKIIILGGPEVSYNAAYYIDNNLSNYVIKNEGEEAFDLLLKHIHGDLDVTNVPNLYYKNGFTFDKLVDISKINFAYDLLDDVENKIMYIETSRGCPYKCGYCMASLDNKLRFFDIELIKKEIIKLQNRKAKTFKFLDRTFNANKKFIELIDFIVDNHKINDSYQFEITGDLLKTEYIQYINQKAPKNLIRFEIGIQSTNYETNLSVGRIQNNEVLFRNINLIQDANIIDLHLDLIAGLPLEDYKSFEKTFNDVIALRPKELQLGFLKLLFGTRLHKEAHKYEYLWDECAPYEIKSNKYLSCEDIKNIHIVEDTFEKYYNSQIMPNAMKIILDNEDNHFDFFYSFGLNLHNITTLENRFKEIDNYIMSKPYYTLFHKAIIIDYLNYYNLRPKAWWNELIDKKNKNNILRKIHEEYNLDIPLIDLYKYSLVIDLNEDYILAVYKPNQKIILNFKK